MSLFSKRNFSHGFWVLALLVLCTCAKPPAVTTDTVRELSLGGPACTIVNEGLQCWGNNVYGQLGNGLIIDSLRPVKTIGLTGKIEHISSGNAHMCAVADGIPYCWGYNAFGSTGTGDRGVDHVTPTQVLGTYTNIKQLSSRANATCLLSDEGVSCWGGYVGTTGHTSADDTPVLVSLPGLPTSIARGIYHTCVLIDGGVWCWGKNEVGQLGRGGTSTQELTAGLVSGLGSGVSAITALYDSTCALLTSGSIKCWGENVNGQLGNNSTTDSSTPVDVSRLTSGVTSISGGHKHMMAVADGQLFAWGINSSYQLGDGTATDSPTPIGVVGIEGTVETVATGPYNSCALVSQKLYCWGSAGALGNGKLLVPNKTPGLVGAFAK